MKKTSVVEVDAKCSLYTCYEEEVLGKPGNGRKKFVCQMWNYKSGAICGRIWSSKKEVLRHQKAKMHVPEALRSKSDHRSIVQDSEYLTTQKQPVAVKIKKQKQLVIPKKQKNERPSTAELVVSSAHFTPRNDADDFDELISQMADMKVNIIEDNIVAPNCQVLSDLAATVESVLPVQQLQLWHADKAANMLSYVPPYCNKCMKGEKCHITAYDRKARERCFDINNPFILEYQRYNCHSHASVFSLFHLQLSQAFTVTPQVVAFERTIVSARFIDYLYTTIPNHSFNFAALARSISSTWIANLTHKLRMALFTKVLKEDDIAPLITNIEDNFKITNSTLEALYMFKYRLQQAFFQQHADDITAKSGKVLRVDHTYKIASCLSALHQGKRVSIKASLLSILNEKGQVLSTKLVPSDERNYMAREFDRIWLLHDSPVTTHIYTDDSRKDKNFIEQAWREAFPGVDVPKTCQDVWHVIHRIDSVMAHNHPDYRQAKQDLSAIFAQLSHSSEASTELLISLLKDWIAKYKQAQRDNDSEMQLFIENLASRVTECVKVSSTNFTLISLSSAVVKEANYPSIITSKVSGAVNNFTNPSAGYATAVVNTVSLTDFKQGTSANEAWHKYLKKNSPFYSGSCSLELMTAVIIHLQFLFNHSLEVRRQEKNNTEHSNLHTMVMLSLTLSTPFVLNANQSLAQLLTFKTLDDLKKLDCWTTKKANYPKVSPEDVEKCIDGLRKMQQEREGISQGLLYWLTHYIFDEKYSKGYVKKVIYQVAKSIK